MLATTLISDIARLQILILSPWFCPLVPSGHARTSSFVWNHILLLGPFHKVLEIEIRCPWIFAKEINRIHVLSFLMFAHQPVKKMNF